ncbi:NAD(P)H-hydrate dehydratase [Sungkyunkwania multivorans]|uniref:Bifunctional NAD(P)H-hydrate repair enzyme n=1 Tax=Sungkyunkwania multivorans TaxID=1173618 RepID=A0ABW3CUE3_9FLAO
MKIFTAEQLYEADKITIKKNKIASSDLMEHAATQVFTWIHSRMQGAPVPIHVFCGIGNNGGDGLVLGRHLLQHGYKVQVYVVNFSDQRSEDFLLNYNRLKDAECWPTLIKGEGEFPKITKDDIVVDAIFGLGLNRAPEGWVKALMQHVNDARAYTIAVDVPSGLYANSAPDDMEAVVHANMVLTFQAPKLSFFLPETGKFLQSWEVLDIGLDPEYLNATDVTMQLIGKQEVLPMYVPRQKYSHKGNYGHSLIIGGSFGKIGAVSLAGKACLTTGAGLVTAYIPECGYEILQIAVPEVMVTSDPGKRQIADIKFDMAPTVIGVGPGMGTDDQTRNAFAEFIRTNECPLVIDADGLNILAAEKELLESLPAKTVLTPHPGELERLIGAWTDDFDKLEKTKAFAKKYDLVIVVKGAHSVTVCDQKLYINTTGNPGMATGGSGDVLLGMITGLISQGYDPLQAAVFGVYLHGRAADIAVNDTSYQGLLASDIIDYIGDAFIDLFKRPEPPVHEEEGKHE